MQDKIFDVIVLGSGPSGLAAAIYTSRAFLKTLVVAGLEAGGQLVTTTEVENYPGFPNGITGPELMANMRAQAKRFETEFIDEDAVKISGSFKDTFSIETTSGSIVKARSVIVATGSSAKWLGLESEQRLRGKGVSACATCDGFFFKDKEIAVVGGGDASMEEAIFLTKFATKVHLIVRKDKDGVRASPIMYKRAVDNKNIEFHFNTQVKEVLGEESVTGLRLFNSVTNEESELAVQGLFVAIGHRPNTDFLKDFIDLDKKDYIVTEGTRTSKEDVFAAGDVTDHIYMQAATAVGSGVEASLDCVRFLDENGIEAQVTPYV
jgi:thioredoxin reductase (NADPH)